MSGELATPWAPGTRAYSLPGSLLLTMALGEAPEDVPSCLDCRARRQAAATKLDGGPVDRLIRHYTDGARIARVHAAAASLRRPGERHIAFDDLEHALGLARTFRIDTAPGAPLGALANALCQVSTVESASPNWVAAVPFEGLQPLVGPDLELAWRSREFVRAAEALAYEPGDPAVIVAVVDSGVARAHPEMEGRLRSGVDTVQLGASDLALGVQLVGDRTRVDTDPSDEYVGHGMGCAGIIAAVGERIPPGLAGLAPVLPIRVLGAARLPAREQPVGLGAISDIDGGVGIAVNLGAKVLNLSFGTGEDALEPGGKPPHADVVRYALERGCVLVAASGNSGATERYWPAAFDGVIAVGSVDAHSRPSTFSTRGSHVALCAPGERIVTLGLEGYQLATGTSFAAPFVAATAALLVARAQRRSVPVDGARVKAILCASATPFTGGATDGCGIGVLDAAAALRTLDASIDRALARGEADPTEHG